MFFFSNFLSVLFKHRSLKQKNPKKIRKLLCNNKMLAISARVLRLYMNRLPRVSLGCVYPLPTLVEVLIHAQHEKSLTCDLPACIWLVGKKSSKIDGLILTFWRYIFLITAFTKNSQLSFWKIALTNEGFQNFFWRVKVHFPETLCKLFVKFKYVT